MKLPHKKAWDVYPKVATEIVTEAYFVTVKVLFVNALRVYADNRCPTKFVINASMPEKTIRKLLLHHSLVKRVNHSGAMKLLKKLEEPNLGTEDLGSQDLYKTELKKS